MSTKTKNKITKVDDKATSNDDDDNASDDAQDYLNSLEEKAKEKGDSECIFC